MFNTCSNIRAVRIQKRHCLSLHVCAHKSTCAVIVFQERNACSRNRYDLLRTYVGIVDLIAVDHDSFTGNSCDYLCTCDLSIMNFVCLCNNVVVLFICGHIYYCIRNNAAFVYLTVRSLDKSILVYTGICCQIGNQADVRSFRCLDRADSSIVRVMNITYFKSCSFTSQSAWTQGTDTSLIGEFSQWILLIHEL